jgi:hypothetical protein
MSPCLAKLARTRACCSSGVILWFLRAALPMDTPSNAHDLPESKQAGASMARGGALTDKMA